MSNLLVIALAVCLHLPATAQVSNATFEQKITVSTKSVRIDSLLKVFSRQTGVEFSFNPTKVKPSKTLAVTRRQQTLMQWLTTLRQQVGVQHKVVGNHIILFDNDPVTTASSKVVSKPTTRPAKKPSAPAAPPSKTTVIIIDSIRTSAKDTLAHQRSSGITNAGRDNTPASAIPAQRPSGSTVADTTRKASPAKQATPAKKATPAVRRVAAEPANPRQRQESVYDDKWAEEAIQFMGGFSHHGSGDMEGIVFGASYTKYLSRRFSLNIDLRGTVNHERQRYKYPGLTPGATVESNMRFTTGGAQLGLDAQLSVIRSRHHEVMFSLGGFGRYQSSSPDGYSITPPQASGTPEILYSMINWNPQNTIAAGVLFQLHYNFTLDNNMLLGLKAGIQTDTNGDLILQAGLAVGKRF